MSLVFHLKCKQLEKDLHCKKVYYNISPNKRETKKQKSYTIRKWREIFVIYSLVFDVASFKPFDDKVALHAL